MDITTTAQPTAETEDVLMVEVGNLVELTQGQGQGSSEDKRRAYNA